MTTQNKYTPLFILVLLKAVGALCILFLFPIYLGPDEAQYWTWSKTLSLGYYSKPPGIAFQIYLGTLFFGDTEWGVRSIPFLFSLLFPFLLFSLSKKGGLSNTAATLAAACILFTPIGWASSLFAITDNGLFLFWILSFFPLLSLLEKKKESSYLTLGLLIGLGALFKWPIFILWPSLFLFLKIKKEPIPFNYFLGGVCLSLLGLLPSFIWNIDHDFATFKHVFTQIQGGEKPLFSSFNPLKSALDFFFSQVALLSPFIFILSFYSFFRFYKEKNPPLWISFCAFLTFFLFGIALTLSFFQKIQGNWIAYAYLSLFILLGYTFRKKPLWMYFSLIFSSFLIFIAVSIPLFQEKNLFSNYPIPSSKNPFKHNVGWENLSKSLLEKGYHSPSHFLFADQYQITSLLSFYGPTKKRAYFFNLQNSRWNQFSFWEGMEKKEIGNSGFFVAVTNGLSQQEEDILIKKYEEELAPYFEKVIFKGTSPLFAPYGRTYKKAFFFLAENYNGKTPALSTTF